MRVKSEAALETRDLVMQAYEILHRTDNNGKLIDFIVPCVGLYYCKSAITNSITIVIPHWALVSPIKHSFEVPSFLLTIYEQFEDGTGI